MNAQWRQPPAAASSGTAAATAPRRLRPMTRDRLDAVMAVETAAYAFPWTRGNFADALVAGYPAWLLVDPADRLLGYFVAMGGVEEMHLLNLTVAPADQHRGHARWLLDALVDQCRADGAAQLWLEVRTGNARARALYERLGFAPVGVRAGYYPAPHGRREDAVVMNLEIAHTRLGTRPAADPPPNDAGQRGPHGLV